MLPGIWPVVVIRQQVVPPIHDTKPNLEIVQGLAKRLGLSDYFDYTIEQWVEAQAEELPVPNALEHLKQHGVFAAQGAPFYGSTRKPDHRFLTKSGKIELFSRAARRGGPRPAARLHAAGRSRPPERSA